MRSFPAIASQEFGRASANELTKRRQDNVLATVSRETSGSMCPTSVPLPHLIVEHSWKRNVVLTGTHSSPLASAAIIRVLVKLRHCPKSGVMIVYENDTHEEKVTYVVQLKRHPSEAGRHVLFQTCGKWGKDKYKKSKI